jgi:hypothetical protein
VIDISFEDIEDVLVYLRAGHLLSKKLEVDDLSSNEEFSTSSSTRSNDVLLKQWRMYSLNG